MKFNIDNNKNKSSQNKLLQTRKLDDGSQWLKSMVPPDLMDKKFVMGLYDGLKNDPEFTELIASTKQISNSLNAEKSIVDSTYYDNLSKTHLDVKEKFALLEKKLVEQILKEKKHTYKDKPHTHSGFAYYLFYCWSNEMGICLRPDMIYYTVVCETVSHILKNKDQYKHLFTDHNDKSVLEILVDHEFDIDIDTLDAVLNDVISNVDFKKLITETKFDSQPENFSTVLKFSFVKMASAYFNFLMSMCGISTVEVVGSQDEWLELLNKLAKLSEFVPSLQQYYFKCTETVQNIVTYGFGSDQLESSKFFENVFWLEDPCSSGHTHVIKGWFSSLYVDSYESLEDYPVHANYIPYIQKESGKNYIKVMGMTYSDELDGTLYPQYGEIVYEVVHSGIYKVLTNSGNVELTDESRMKSMIRSMNSSMGYYPTDEQVEQVFTKLTKLETTLETIHEDEKSDKSDNNLMSAMVKLMNDVTCATDRLSAVSASTTKVVKENWGSALIISIGAVVVASAMFMKFSK